MLVTAKLLMPVVTGVEQPRFATFQSSSTFVLDAKIVTGVTETRYSRMVWVFEVASGVVCVVPGGQVAPAQAVAEPVAEKLGCGRLPG